MAHREDTSPDRAAAALLRGRSSATVLSAMSPQQPDALLHAIIETARTGGVALTILFADLDGALPFLDRAAEHDLAEGRLRLVSLAGAVKRGLADRVDHIPGSLWDVDRMLASGRLPVDIVVARMSRTADPRWLSYGAMAGYTESALSTDAVGAFELVEADGPAYDCGLPTDRASVLVAGNPSIPARANPARPDAVREEVALRAARLIPDDATLELGLGAIPEAMVPHLAGGRGLGLHSGILFGALQSMIAAGRITGSHKRLDAGLHVATGLLLDETTTGQSWGPDVRIRPVSATHDPRTLLAHERLWAVNSAFEIDLAGQVNAEFVGGVRVASGGGQADFVRAAHACDGGASVIVLPSRTRSGRSRICAHLGAPHRVTSPGQEIDIVVTEYGAADLRGRSAGEKAAALIAIAHPDDRAGLRRLDR